MKKLLIFIMICTSLIANDYNDAIKLYNENNFKDAAVSFEKAANSGNIEAAYIMGYIYTGGQGVKQNLKESLSWYTKAAALGHTNAQINLGFMYIGGQGTKLDYKKAAYWIGKAKASGSSKAALLWDEFKLSDYMEKN
ncbi:MAG: sel1 repeat family protein [Campylobacteraceae bacterium]|jgi:hypothetical protein|nr:sel1 repeat family protein [Campylobacteraceae bacterium]MBT3883038.1 sel1 repeat family protein [Campylobacteraceae bacterium]MBT4030698.1 sel1 repeat family protein [Campylobacteraceae bacterium]MBT4178676.1 sel1 repeat family protein [Campylobacteraceae bacterium]MBT4572669.1 sel1 repeat family protein [Campylobacteraceae bacterium]